MRAVTPTLLLLAQIAAIAACSRSTDVPTAPSAATAVPELASLAARPLVGTCETTYELINPEFQPPPRDQDLANADYTDDGSCRLSHLGKATLANHGSIDFTQVPARGLGTFTLTAANGDQLEGRESIDYYPPDENGVFGFSGVRFITAGTGRFAGAHGSLSVSGTGSTETSTTQQFHDGRAGF